MEPQPVSPGPLTDTRLHCSQKTLNTEASQRLSRRPTCRRKSRVTWINSGKRFRHHPTASVFSRKTEAKRNMHMGKEILLPLRPDPLVARSGSPGERSCSCCRTARALRTASVPRSAQRSRLDSPGALPLPPLPRPLACHSQLQ